MVQVIFKNLDKSELAREAASQRFADIIDRFPDLKPNQLRVTLSMENSPLQAGPDVFRVKAHVYSGRYKGLTLQKSAGNLYAALADVVEHMLEALNRRGDRRRVRERQFARRSMDTALIAGTKDSE